MRLVFLAGILLILGGCASSKTEADQPQHTGKVDVVNGAGNAPTTDLERQKQERAGG